MAWGQGGGGVVDRGDLAQRETFVGWGEAVLRVDYSPPTLTS